MGEAVLEQDYNPVYRQYLIDTLSSYREIRGGNAGNTVYEQINDSYFLDNDVWHIDILGSITQFKTAHSKFKNRKKYLHFQFANTDLNLEMKFLAYKRLLKVRGD